MKYFIILFVSLCFISINQTVSAQTANFLDPNVAPLIEYLGTSVNAIAKQSDGKILVGGNFYLGNDEKRLGLARFNPDGSLDESFNFPIYFYPIGIRAIVVQTDGKILVGGHFASPTGEPKNIVRLNSDGSEDASFTARTNSAVYAIALQSDGKILIGGAFTSVNGINRFGSARLNINGSTDISFTLAIRTVFAIAVQSDGNILLGGTFVSTSPNVVTRIVRVSSTGAIDTAFSANASADSTVEVIKLQTDGKILLSGLFSNVNGVNQAGITRLNADGVLDGSFRPALAGGRASVESIDLDATGKVLIGGNFTSVNGTPRPYIAKLDNDGTLNTTFAPTGGADAAVRAVLVESDGNILTGGEFQNFNGTTKYRFARLNANGGLVSSFNAALNTNGIVSCIEIQPDGKFIAAGNFFHVNGNRYSSIIRFLPDGTIDPSFATSAQTQFLGGDPIENMEILPDGKIVIVGVIVFPAQPNVSYAAIRLNADGTVDNTFAPVTISDNYPTTVVKPLPNGQIIIGGRNLKKFNSNGTLDTSFNPMFGAQGSTRVYDINIRNDGKILVGGFFDTVNGTPRKNLALLNADGTLDTNFSANVSSAVLTIEKLSDGNLLISGFFTSVNGTPRNNVAKLLANGQLDISFNVDTTFAFPNQVIKTLPDGKIILAGQKNYSSTITNNFVVLNPNGSINTFLPNNRGFNDSIYDVEVQSDGKILVGGQFTKVGTSVRYGLARLNSINFPVKSSFDFDGDGKADVSVFRPDNSAWYLQQSTNGFTGFQFGLRTDKIVPADYDGDGKTDVAVYRDRIWYLQRSQLGFTGIQFGTTEDIPVPADYDGDGKADIAVFRPSNGVWYLQRSQLGFTGIAFGQTGDKPVAADYDGDNKADVAVFRNGTWYLQRSQAGFTAVQFGASDDKLVPADYDGDGKADVAVFRPSNGTWYLLQSTMGFAGVAFGFGTDKPVPADYDGDGKTDIAVFRDGAWYLQRSSQGFTSIAFGGSGDQPIPNAYVR